MASKVNVEGSGIMLNVGAQVDTTSMKKVFLHDLNYLQQKSQITLTVDGTQFTKTIRQYEDAAKNLIETSTLWNHSLGKGVETVTKITNAEERFNSQLQQAANNTKNLSTAQQNLNTHVAKSKTLFSDFAATFAKMAKFNTINLIYDGMITKMRECIEVTNQFDAAMTEFKKVTDTSQLSLSEYSDTLGEFGEATARTTKLVWSNV